MEEQIYRLLKIGKIQIWGKVEFRTSDARASGAVHDVFDAETRQRIQGQLDSSHFQREIDGSYWGSSEKCHFLNQLIASFRETYSYQIIEIIRDKSKFRYQNGIENYDM